MAKVEIYLTSWCPFCHRAKALLDSKGVSYVAYDIEASPERFQEMQTRAKRHTVPQIFINEQGIGGCDDLYALEQAHKLDDLLA